MLVGADPGVPLPQARDHVHRDHVATGLLVRQTWMPDAEASFILHLSVALGSPLNLSEPHWPNVENGNSDNTHQVTRGWNENTQRAQISTVPHIY